MSVSIRVAGQIASIPGMAQVTRNALLGMSAIIRKELTARAKGAFDVGGHHMHGGMPWKPLKLSTLAIKSKLGYPLQPLVRTGTMSDLINVRVGLIPLGNGGIQWEIQVANEAPYAKYHQSGFRHVWGGRVPARPPIKVTHDDLEMIGETIRTYMIGGKIERVDKTTKKKGIIASGVNRFLGLFTRNSIFGRFRRGGK